jgi:hypothetical protein
VEFVSYIGPPLKAQEKLEPAPAVTCPECHSALIVEISNQKHCNACGKDFGIVRNATPRSERFDWSGYRR